MGHHLPRGRANLQHSQSIWGLISPPPAFKTTSGSASELAAPISLRDPQQRQQPRQQPTTQRGTLDESAAPADSQTELTTRLTRCKFKQREDLPNDATKQRHHDRKRTITKLDQNLIAPNFHYLVAVQRDKQQQLAGDHPEELKRPRTLADSCRFKAQVVFESDTDSAAERHSSAGAQRRPPQVPLSTDRARSLQARPDKERKQLISETKYSLTNGAAAGAQASSQDAESCKQQQQQAGKVAAAATASQRQQLAGAKTAQAPAQAQLQQQQQRLQPNWEYSLRLNRMRGNKVEGKVK